jgi:hypothetical protein
MQIAIGTWIISRSRLSPDPGQKPMPTVPKGSVDEVIAGMPDHAANVQQSIWVNVKAMYAGTASEQQFGVLFGPLKPSVKFNQFPAPGFIVQIQLDDLAGRQPELCRVSSAIDSQVQQGVESEFKP